MPGAVSQAFARPDLQPLSGCCGARAGGQDYFGTRTVHTLYPAGKLLF